MSSKQKKKKSRPEGEAWDSFVTSHELEPREQDLFWQWLIDQAGFSDVEEGYSLLSLRDAYADFRASGSKLKSQACITCGKTEAIYCPECVEAMIESIASEREAAEYEADQDEWAEASEGSPMNLFFLVVRKAEEFWKYLADRCDSYYLSMAVDVLRTKMNEIHLAKNKSRRG